MKYLPFVAYVACIVIANWLTTTYRTGVPVGFGLIAPAGVYFAGLCFAARNFSQLTLGRRWGFAAILVGAAVSAAISDHVSLGGPLPLAFASGLTFLCSETADMAMWTPLRSRGLFIGAMVAGEVLAMVVDSLLFLFLAFGSEALLAGQIVGKLETVAPVVVGMWLWRQRHGPHVLPRDAQTELAGAD